MPVKLDDSQKHMLRLVRRGADTEGWAPVSAAVAPLLDKLPKELVTIEYVGPNGRCRVKLTSPGSNLLDAMEWL